jgi:hypothetical protein
LIPQYKKGRRVLELLEAATSASFHIFNSVFNEGIARSRKQNLCLINRNSEFLSTEYWEIERFSNNYQTLLRHCREAAGYINATGSFRGNNSESKFATKNLKMFVKLLIALSAFAFLAEAKECKPGLNCDLKCCTTSEGDVQCRARCLGLSCELDAHCDGDCCVNSTCTSCLVKRLVNK